MINLKQLLTESSDFDKYADALTKYEKASQHSKYERELSSLFSGGKLTSRFIFRAGSKPTPLNYAKDCKDFGKKKIDDLVDKVLNIIE
jgi:hypothetical protein